MQPLKICIGPNIRIGRESWCLTYAGFSPTQEKSEETHTLYTWLCKSNVNPVLMIQALLFGIN